VIFLRHLAGLIVVVAAPAYIRVVAVGQRDKVIRQPLLAVGVVVLPVTLLITVERCNL
jgi:hypothetical protein